MRILFWDIETLPNLQYSFGRWDPAISHNAILKERTICAICYKFNHDTEVKVCAIDIADPYNDKCLLADFYAQMEKADLIVAHYGDKFDLPFFKGRMLLNGMPPLKPIKTEDTYKIAKKMFKLNSNKLDYLGHMLGFGKKHKMDYNDWLGICNGEQKSLDKMVRYCKQDVLLLEKIYKKLSPWHHTSTVNHALVDGFNHLVACPNPACNSCNVIRKGKSFTKIRVNQDYQCKKCGRYFSRPLKAA